MVTTQAAADAAAFRRCNALAFELAGVGGLIDVDALLADDDELRDDPDGPFGNRGGKFVQSRLRDVEGRFVSPTIATPLADVPEPFKAQHYGKILSPAAARRLVVANAWTLPATAPAEALAELEAALDAAAADVRAALGVVPSTRLAAEEERWTAPGVRGSIEGWEPGDVSDAVWAVRYAYFRRADLPKTDAPTWIFRGDESRRRRGYDMDIQRRRVTRLRYKADSGGGAVGFNAVLSEAVDHPHLAVYVGLRGNKASLVADYVPRRDIAVPTGLFASDLPDALLKRPGVSSVPSFDARVRATRSPAALAASCDAASTSDVAALAAALRWHVDLWLAGLEVAAAPSDPASVAARDATVRASIRAHEADAGRPLLGDAAAERLARAMAGPRIDD